MHQGAISIDAADIPDLVSALKVTVTFWVSYIKTLHPNQSIEKHMVYKCVLTVLAMLKPYLNETDRQEMRALQQHYADLAEQSQGADRTE